MNLLLPVLLAVQIVASGQLPPNAPNNADRDVAAVMVTINVFSPNPFSLR